MFRSVMKVCALQGKNLGLCKVDKLQFFLLNTRLFYIQALYFLTELSLPLSTAPSQRQVMVQMLRLLSCPLFKYLCPPFSKHFKFLVQQMQPIRDFPNPKTMVTTATSGQAVKTLLVTNLLVCQQEFVGCHMLVKDLRSASFSKSRVWLQLAI